MISKRNPYPAIAARVVKHFGGKAAVSRALGYSDRRNVSKWVNGDLPFPTKHCLAIERLSGNEITRKFLRPLDFAEHWPDLY
jgi:DNA-binding transcriptional regulator YdaS (Cro superfamily)